MLRCRMSARHRSPAALVLLLAVAASFAFATIAGAAIHTDDGCQVELHCFACHWAFASTGIMAPLVTLNTSLGEIGLVRHQTVLAPAEEPAPRLSSRSPPAF